MYRVFVITWYGVPIISVLLSPTYIYMYRGRSLTVRSDIFRSLLNTINFWLSFLSQQQIVLLLVLARLSYFQTYSITQQWPFKEL